MKKLISVFCAVLMIVSVSTVMASAEEISTYKNNTDTVFHAYDLYEGYTSESRAKEDSSGTYVYFQAGSCSYARFIVYGVDNGVYTDRTYPNAYMYNGSQRLISQYVYERGERRAALGLGLAGYGGDAYGVWSPDSVGDYPYAN